MSIKPIDLKITIPKLQRISEINQIENNKPRNDILSLEMQHQKRIDKQSKIVVNTKETNKSKINDDKENNKNKRDAKKHNNKKDKSNNIISDIDGIGKKIDIKI